MLKKIRNARIFVVVLKDSYSNRDDDDKAVDFSDAEKVPYELVVGKQFPPEGFIVTNVWHPYTAISECADAGIRLADTAESLKEIYNKYNIDLTTWLRRES